MTSEAVNQTGIEIIVGTYRGASSTRGITIKGSTEVEGVAVKVDPSEDPKVLKEKYCARINGFVPSCPLCTANVDYPSQVKMLCPFPE